MQCNDQLQSDQVNSNKRDNTVPEEDMILQAPSICLVFSGLGRVVCKPHFFLNSRHKNNNI